jgi:hypothetical protein
MRSRRFSHAHRKIAPLAGAVLLLLFVGAWRGAGQSPAWLSAPRTVAPGVDYYTSTDPSLVDPAGPLAVYLLKLDPARVRLASVLSNDEVYGAETVDSIAERHHAVAAINGGFFNTKNGEPVGLLKVAGVLVSDTPITKGMVAIQSPAKGRTTLDFDQASVSVALTFKEGGHDWRVPVDGVDTTRERGKLMLYNASYHADTDTAPEGTEWVLTGRPLTVREIRSNTGHTLIPRDGIVLSYGGVDLPPPLEALRLNVRVDMVTAWKTLNGLSPSQLDRVDDIVNGAGLLRRKGRLFTDWTVEKLAHDTFLDVRHPRTLIGVDDHGFIWLAAIDGRQPDHSVGMMFSDLQRLCDRLHLRDALNLDGGGSTTMVIGGEIVNKPSDAAGPRPVSDAILVTIR